MGKLTQVKTYAAYDDEGNRVYTCTAADANKDINPEEVQAAADKVTGQAESLVTKYNRKLNNLKDFSYTAIVVQDYNFEGYINQIVDSTKSLKSQITTYMNDMTTAARKAHNELQQKYNEEARSKASQYGSVKEV